MPPNLWQDGSLGGELPLAFPRGMSEQEPMSKEKAPIYLSWLKGEKVFEPTSHQKSVENTRWAVLPELFEKIDHRG